MNKKRFFMALLVLAMCIGILAVPAAAAEGLTTNLDVNLPVAVEIDGYEPMQKDTYKIIVTPDGPHCPMPDGGKEGVYELVGKGEMELSFHFTGLGVYKYTISQGDCGNADCYHDGKTYDFIVQVLNPEEPGSQFKYNVVTALTVNGQPKPEDPKLKPDAVLFTNKYAEPAAVKLAALKTYNGKTPKTGLFDFQLKDATGKVLQTVSNVGKDVLFEDLVFDKTGTYTFTINEVVDNRVYVVFDRSVYTVTVEVTRDIANKGNYVAKVTYSEEGKTVSAGDVKFVNKSLTETPFTGDQFNLVLWCTILVVSLTGIIVLLIVRKKQKK